VNLTNTWQAVYTAGVVLPRPVGRCRYWHRSLNPKKLIEVRRVCMRLCLRCDVIGVLQQAERPMRTTPFILFSYCVVASLLCLTGSFLLAAAEDHHAEPPQEPQAAREGQQHAAARDDDRRRARRAQAAQRPPQQHVRFFVTAVCACPRRVRIGNVAGQILLLGLVYVCGVAVPCEPP
jgi:hypothetical protein